MHMATSRITALVFALIALGVAAPSGAGNACRATATAANRACRSEKTDEVWIAAGDCLNLPTADATKACKKAAKQDLNEAKGDCGDQLDARNELCDQLGKAP